MCVCEWGLSTWCKQINIKVKGEYVFKNSDFFVKIKGLLLFNVCFSLMVFFTFFCASNFNYNIYMYNVYTQ